PLQHHTWSVWGINAARLQLTTLKVGDTGAWPPGFDTLADHVAVAPPPPSPSPAPIAFEALTGEGSHTKLPVRELVAAGSAGRLLWAIVETGSVTTAAGLVPRTELMRSDDGGARWVRVSGGPALPAGVAASGATVLASSIGEPLDDGKGTSSGGGLFLTRDGGVTWRRVVDEGVRRVRTFEYQGRRLFLAERPWTTRGAATGPSRILASLDGETWRAIGEVPGPASFALLDVPLVTFAKNVSADGFYRVEGADLASLALVAVPRSTQAGSGSLITAPGGVLWHVDPNAIVVARRSTDSGRTWLAASDGLAGRIAGLFVLRDRVYAVGDGAYVWDGSRWTVVAMRGSKTQAVFPVGDAVIIQALPGHLERSR
ncbi:MAG TPA: hypothetical protein VFM06_06910, partial [Candidatus Limnocylindria bacterium]|nr:hypothetical protein [Candidatus Limnocylindria bacterium]